MNRIRLRPVSHVHAFYVSNVPNGCTITRYCSNTTILQSKHPLKTGYRCPFMLYPMYMLGIIYNTHKILYTGTVCNVADTTHRKKNVLCLHTIHDVCFA